jgi:SAM-dependent methyltransferase
MLEEAHLAYFRSGKKENSRFWSRFPQPPELAGKKVLDVGCGHGSLAVEMAQKGAARVVGVDPNRDLIDFARRNVEINYPRLRTVLEFQAGDIAAAGESRFDLIVSKDTFEHILDPAGTLAAMRERIVPGGYVYIGFSPLYCSPWGDHRRTEAVIPWGHLIFPDKLLIRRLNRKYPAREIKRIEDLGLNQYSPARFRELFAGCGLQPVWLGVNRSGNPAMKLFDLFRKLPRGDKLFTHNMYCILRKKEL